MCPFLVIYVGAGAHPLDDLALLISQWKGTSDMPAINTVRCALEPVFNLIIAASRECFRPALNAILEVVRVQHMLPAPVLRLLDSHAGVVEPALVIVVEIPVRFCRPNNLRHRIGEEAVALGALDQLGRACIQRLGAYPNPYRKDDDVERGKKRETKTRPVETREFAFQA